MPVELPQLCSLLAHELRSPLSVLQGYIRLLQRSRAPEDPEHAMLTAMLEATGRLSWFARQSSELGAWMRTRDETSGAALRVDALYALLLKTDSRHTWALDETPSLVSAQIAGGADGAILTTSLVAVADAVAREHNSAAAVAHISSADGTTLTVTVRPSTPRKASQTRASAAPDRDAFFVQGGLGLGLVTASHVFAYLQGTVARQSDDSLQLTFPLKPSGGPP